MVVNDQINFCKFFWDDDPTGRIVVDSELIIQLVNPAFCQMFKIEESELIGQNVSEILNNSEDFKTVLETNQIIWKDEEYLDNELFVKQGVFPMAQQEEKYVAGVIVDITAEQTAKKELRKLKQETVKQVNQVVDKQMKVVQEIAGLLGETTAETKISLLKIIKAIESETI